VIVLHTRIDDCNNLIWVASLSGPGLQNIHIRIWNPGRPRNCLADIFYRIDQAIKRVVAGRRLDDEVGLGIFDKGETRQLVHGISHALSSFKPHIFQAPDQTVGPMGNGIDQATGLSLVTCIGGGLEPHQN